ncbi:MAG TPA: Zn-ribbon domain-containing OB-fold protein [Acidimicrobiales bacterium]|nr:Zn-ribbon domain-containing OB-fold protein [Acidimicrobiales bacterium]
MSDASSPTDAGGPGAAPVTTLSTPIRIDYQYTAGLAQSRYLHGMAQGKFLGQRCPRCRQVYVPPRGSCPTDGVATTDQVELGNTGTVTTYCVVNVPFQGQSIEIPYICAQVLLDGANIAFMGLIQEIPPDQVRMGLRVEAVWVDESELGLTSASVKYFRPSGEPDADYESFKEYL